MEALVLLFVIFVCLVLSAGRKSVLKRRKEAYDFQPVAYDNPNSAASARWATDKALKKAGLFKGKGWRIGCSQKGRVMRYGGPGHLLLVAGARKGKMISVLAPAALDRCKASRIFIDPKGELCAVTHKRAAQFSQVVALDPFGILRTARHQGYQAPGPQSPRLSRSEIRFLRRRRCGPGGSNRLGAGREQRRPALDGQRPPARRRRYPCAGEVWAEGREEPCSPSVT